jgi:hypothetical protein
MAQDAGADVVLELKSDGLGRRGYSCRDPEGHIWNFGTYNPGRGLAVTLAGAAAEGSEPPRRSGRVAISLAALFVAFGATCWVFADSIRADLSMRIATAAGHQSAREAENAYRELVKVRAEKRKAEETAQAASAALAIERARRLALESNPGSDAVSKLTEAESARRAAEAAVATLREELARKQNALDAAIEAKRVSEEKLAVNAAKPEAGSQNAAPIAGEPPLARSAAQPQTPSGDRNGIETSATRSAPEDEGSRADETATDGDDESRGAGSIAFSRAGPSRPASTVAQRRKSSASKRRYPAYVVDLDHVWPYNGWQN